MKKNLLRTLIIISILILLLFLCYPKVYIVTENNRVLSSHLLLPGEGFTFKYTHSVEKTTVIEEYQLNWSGKLIMTETRFKSYGAGLPLETENFSTEGEFFILRDMDIKLPQVRIRVSRTPGQSITFEKDSCQLQNLARPGQVIVVKPVSFIKFLIDNN